MNPVMASRTPQKCEEPATPAGMRLVLCEIHDAVHTQLDDYGLTALVGADAYFSPPADVPAAW